jgi:hypothetical protein
MSRGWKIVLLFASLGGFAVHGQITLLSQRFNDVWSTTVPPTGWQIHYTGPVQASDWHRAPDLGPNPWVENQTYYPLIFWQPAKTVVDSFVSPELDCSPCANVVLRCLTKYTPGNGVYAAQIVGSTDGGVTWPFVVRSYERESLPGTPEMINLSWADRKSRVRLAWVLNGILGDSGYWAFDDVTVTGMPPVHDMGIAELVRPVGVADSGVGVVPAAWVRNFGTIDTSFTVRFRIGDFYDERAGVNGLVAGESALVEFPVWEPRSLGQHAVSCSTELAGDEGPGNDCRRDSVTVMIRDVSVYAFTVPIDSTDSGQVYVPEAMVMNLSTGTTSIPVVMTLAGNYCDTVVAESVAPETHVTVNFRPWVAGPRGPFLAKCSTALGGDVNPGNDCIANVVFGRVTDVGVPRLLEPRGTFPESTQVTPVLTFANYGNTSPRFWLVCRFVRGSDTVYSESLGPASLPPGGLDTTSLNAVTLNEAGRYLVEAYTSLQADANPANNRDTVVVRVGVHDAGVTAILEPRPRTVSGQILPRVSVKNMGLALESFRVFGSINSVIGPIWQDSAQVDNLPPGEERAVYFAYWNAGRGHYWFRCSLALAKDVNPDNDVLGESTYVDSFSVGWTQLPDMPEGNAGKNVKSGGALAAVDSLIYAFKGGGRDEFYCYNTLQNTWSTACSIPFSVSGKKKRVNKGGALAHAPTQRRLYAFKGGGTSEFWCYRPDSNYWQELAPIPGTKKVKTGGALSFIPSRGIIYAFKGGGTYEFWGYDIARDTWLAQPSIGVAPAPQRAKKVKDGACLVPYTIGPDTFLFALKGGSTREVWCYDVVRDTWIYLDSTPYAEGSKTKVKDGAGAAWNGAERMYMLKGGRTAEFWTRSRLAPAGWLRQFDMPGTVMVKGGGALSYCAGAFYALKGNGTREFYRYLESPSLSIAEPDAPGSERLVGYDLPWVRISPNPAGRRLLFTLYGLAPGSGPASLVVFDASGQQVGEVRFAGQRSIREPRTAVWNCADRSGQRLPAGVYVVRLTGQSGQGAKLVLLGD